MTTTMRQIQETLQKEYKGLKDENYNYKQLNSERLQKFRKQKHAVHRVEKPTNLARARTLGYKAKEGYLVVRVRLRKGSGMHRRPKMARRPKRMAVNKLTRNLSIQTIAEQRAARKFPNCEVLNSYPVGMDGTKHYFEVILVDIAHKAIHADKDISWIVRKDQSGRAWRGLTSSGKKARGLRNKGRGAEKARGKKKAGHKKFKKKYYKPNRNARQSKVN